MLKGRDGNSIRNDESRLLFENLYHLATFNNQLLKEKNSKQFIFLNLSLSLTILIHVHLSFALTTYKCLMPLNTLIFYSFSKT